MGPQVTLLLQMGLEANVVTYNSVINACARCANGDRAEFWFQMMIHAGTPWMRVVKLVKERPMTVGFN